MDVKRQLQGALVIGIAFAIGIACLGQTAPAEDSQRQAAFQLEQQGRTAEAEAAWQAVAQAHPHDGEAYAHLGLLHAHEEHYKQAVSYYRKALAMDSKLPGLRLNLGLAYFKGGELKAAAETFETLLRAAPKGSPEALRLTTLIGLADYGLGAYGAAIPHLKEATAADPQNLPFRLALAHSCLWTKQYQCVLDVYHEIVTLNADSAEADMLAGEALDEMKDKPGAAQQFRAAVKADPKMPDVHFGLGYLLWGLLRFDEAAKEFQAELDNNPDHAQALTYLADCDMQLGRPEAARPLLEKAVRINPKIEQAHLDLGILYENAHRQNDAARELKSAERLNPNDQTVHWHLARFYKATGRTADAKIEFDKTRSLQKAADQSVFEQLHHAQEKGNSTEQPAATAGSPQ
ncbi:MAG: tetratricopeptide repeat protein [Terracidiphilus sp.]